MTGSVFYPLGQQIADTIKAHGLTWSATHYMRRGVPLNEFFMLAIGAGAL